MSQPRIKRKEARDLARRIRRQGGTVTLTANGHLRVTGPAGYTVISPDMRYPRTRANTMADLSRIGLVL